MMTFTDFPLNERLHRAIDTAGYTVPTPIQAAALPLALAGHDIVGTAQTGTGKTAAFVLPILQRLLAAPQRGAHPRALILTPTRELAEQIHTTIQQLAQHTKLRSATVYGGVGMAGQERALRNGTEIIVACPGRLLDHVARGNVSCDRIECLVLDEADRMLDMGFLPPITRIIGLLPRDRQTMLFSATFAKELNAFVDKNLNNPQRIDIGLAAPAETVAHALYPVPQHLKTSLLLEVLRRAETDSVLIFTRTKHRANRVTEQLLRAGHKAGVLHSNKSQGQRQLALDQFRSGQLHVLVATDIAARGIDVTTISHVINYDMPDCADAYIHRIGRTGRAERNGEAFTFVTTADASTLRDIERIMQTRLDSRVIDNFDYQRPAPKADEFKREPRQQQPSRRATQAAAPATRRQAPAAPQAPSRQAAAPRAPFNGKGRPAAGQQAAAAGAKPGAPRAQQAKAAPQPGKPSSRRGNNNSNARSFSAPRGERSTSR